MTEAKRSEPSRNAKDDQIYDNDNCGKGQSRPYGSRRNNMLDVEELAEPGRVFLEGGYMQGDLCTLCSHSCVNIEKEPSHEKMETSDEDIEGYGVMDDVFVVCGCVFCAYMRKVRIYALG